MNSLVHTHSVCHHENCQNSIIHSHTEYSSLPFIRCGVLTLSKVPKLLQEKKTARPMVTNVFFTPCLFLDITMKRIQK